MIACPSCHRHHRAATACPFCGAAPAVPRPARRGFNLMMATLTPVLLAACYGMAPKDCDTADSSCDTVTDADGDGFLPPDDCDDANADVFPGAVEVCDDTMDNDCDQAIDGDDADCAVSTR